MLAVLVLVLGACGSTGSTGDSGTAAGEATESGGTRGDVGGNDSLRWGDGDYGIVLAHGAAFDAASWSTQAAALAKQGATVVAVEDISAGAIGRTAKALQDEGIEDVALVGGSAGADAILELAADQPDLPAQLILLSPNAVVDGLGTEPKLFIASKDEPVADVSPQLAAAGPGEDNESVLLPGAAHAQNIFDTDRGDKVQQMILDRVREFSGA